MLNLITEANDNYTAKLADIVKKINSILPQNSNAVILSGDDETRVKKCLPDYISGPILALKSKDAADNNNAIAKIFVDAKEFIPDAEYKIGNGEILLLYNFDRISNIEKHIDDNIDDVLNKKLAALGLDNNDKATNTKEKTLNKTASNHREIESLNEDETEIIEPVPAESTEAEVAEEEQKEILKGALENAVEGLISKSWDFISDINGLISTLDFDYKNDDKESIKEVLNSVVDDLTVNVGMFQKVKEIIDDKSAELVDSGKEKAEEILGNEESTDNELINDEAEKSEETEEGENSPSESLLEGYDEVTWEKTCKEVADWVETRFLDCEAKYMLHSSIPQVVFEPEDDKYTKGSPAFYVFLDLKNTNINEVYNYVMQSFKRCNSDCIPQSCKSYCQEDRTCALIFYNFKMTEKSAIKVDNNKQQVAMA